MSRASKLWGNILLENISMGGRREREGGGREGERGRERERGGGGNRLKNKQTERLTDENRRMEGKK